MILGRLQGVFRVCGFGICTGETGARIESKFPMLESLQADVLIFEMKSASLGRVSEKSHFLGLASSVRAYALPAPSAKFVRRGLFWQVARIFLPFRVPGGAAVRTLSHSWGQLCSGRLPGILPHYFNNTPRHSGGGMDLPQSYPPPFFVILNKCLFKIKSHSRPPDRLDLWLIENTSICIMYEPTK